MRHIFCILLLSSVFLSCTHTSPKTSVDIPLIRNIHKIKELVKIRSEQIKTLTAFINVTIKNINSVKSFKQVVVLGNNKKIRLESLNFFGQPILLLVGGVNGITLFNSQENRFFTGEYRSTVFASLTGMDLSLENIRAILTQDFFTNENYEIEGYVNSQENQSSLISVINPSGGRQDVLFDRNYYPLSVVNYKEGRDIAFKVSYLSYKQVDGRLFPSEIDIEFPARNMSLHLKVDDVELNKSLEDDVFQLSIPSNAKSY